MPIYSYLAHDRRTDAQITDAIEAASEAEAIAAIRKRGLRPIDIHLERGAKGPKRAGAAGRASHRGITAASVTMFTRQLSTLQDAGLPLVQSLQILGNMQRPGPLKRVLARVTVDVEGGEMLSEAMARHPRAWDVLYTNLVKAGEIGGALDVILRRLAEFREKAQRLKRKVIGALVYPIAVLTIAAAILTFIMIFIVPRFEEIFRDLGIKLPTMTALLIGASRVVATWWWAMILAVGAAVSGARLLRRTPTGGAIVDRVALRIPVLGGIIRKGSVARFTRTLGTLVQSGVGFLDALEITRASTPNIVVRDAIAEVRESVKEGETINEPLRRSGVFDDMVVNMIKVGEETGELDRMLLKIADTYDEEVDLAVAAMMALLEPALIIVMGGAVGFIVIALFMPLIEIMKTLNSQAG